MSTPLNKKRTSRSNSRSRNPATVSTVSRAPTLSSMEELSSDIDRSLRNPGLAYLVRSANDDLHDIELRNDGTGILDDPMNERVPIDPANMIVETPAVFTKESFQIEEEDSDMESESDSFLPFLLPRTTEEANHIIKQNCSCNHIIVHNINKNKVYLVKNTPCQNNTQEPEDNNEREPPHVESGGIIEGSDSALDKHLRGVKRSREDYDDLPANAKRVVKDFAEGRIPNFALMDSDTMQLCSDFM